MNYLLQEITKMKGSFLGIGIENTKLKNGVINNSKILSYSFLEENTKGSSKKKFKLNKRRCKVNIKKIRKVFKKKRIDNIVCDFQIIKKFQKTFVRDSVYINKGMLYLYGKKEELEQIKEKYKRYTNDITIKKNEKTYILIINNTNSKNNKIKDIFYYWQDTLLNFLDFLTTILVN